MRRRQFIGLLGVAGGVVLQRVRAAKKTEKQLACTEIKDEFACKGYSDCRWVGASGKKKAGCVKAAKK